MNSLVKGKISIPQPDDRRRLARELGISHLELLVMAGEIDQDEFEEAGVQGVVEPGLEADAMAYVQQIDWRRDDGGLGSTLLLLRESARRLPKRQGERQDDVTS